MKIEWLIGYLKELKDEGETDVYGELIDRTDANEYLKLESASPLSLTEWEKLVDDLESYKNTDTYDLVEGKLKELLQVDKT